MENKGKGKENLIKTEIALGKHINSDVISIEEPENHLSHINLRQMIENIDNNKERKHLVTIMLMDKNYPNIKIEGGKMILWQDIQFQ